MVLENKEKGNSGLGKVEINNEIKKIKVLVSGLPGDMATKVAKKILKQEDMELCSYALTGEGIIEKKGLMFEVEKNFLVVLAEPRDHRETLEKCINDPKPIDMIVDFTAPLVKGQPSQANRNAELFCSIPIPFVTGTTGGDTKLIDKMVVESGNIGVGAPNMEKIIVIFQDMMEYAANKYPGALKEYSVKLKESHQGPRKKEAIKILEEVEKRLQIPLTVHVDQPNELEKIAEEHPEEKGLILEAVNHLKAGKKDTSGTMKAVLKSVNKLGIPVEEKDIEMIRDPEVQEKELGVPKEYLGGHGWHWYNYISTDGTVFLDISHRVNGRDAYAWGTLAPVRFLYKKIQEGVKGKLYSMIEVLSGQEHG